ncbi:hypothetical protein JCM10213v2_007266 [Rhodosporidiobolus nylandii]
MAFSFAPTPAAGGSTPSFVPASGLSFSNSSDPSTTATGSGAAGSAMDESIRAKAPLTESREFITEAYTVWASLQKIVEEYESTAPTSGFRIGRNVPEAPPAEQVAYYGRVCGLYREVIVKELANVKQKADLATHYATMHGILALAQLLYFPADGMGEGLVGEELLDWVNTVDRAPSIEEGAQLSALAAPWDSPNFFPYLYRCVLRGHLSSASALLSLLSTSHPSPFLQSLASSFTSLLTAFPRSTAFRTENAFLSALRSWKAQLAQASKQAEQQFAAAEKDSILGGPDGEDERLEWEAGFRCLLDLLSGRESRVLEVSEDWREALAAWGLWVNPAGFRREDLPATLGVVTREHPIDQTLDDEIAQHALLSGDAAGVLKALTAQYAWAATHLADLLSHLHLPAFDAPAAPQRAIVMGGEGDEAKEEEEEMPLGLREHFLLDWAERLTVDEGLWRVSCEYWGACGAEGRRRARQLLKTLPLIEVEEKKGEQEMDVEGEEGGEKKEKTKRVEEVLRLCADLGLEEEMVGICQSYAASLTAQKRYGSAIAFSVRAGDSRRIAEIAEAIFEEYIQNGQDAFIAHVDSIPTSLLRPSADPSSPSSSAASEDDLLPVDAADGLAPYSARLTFLARYRDFFALYARGDRREAAALLVLLLTSGVAPKGSWAVLLLDVLGLLETSPPLVSLAETYDLLRILEDVVGPVVSSAASSSSDESAPRDVFGHLSALGRLTDARRPAEEKKRERKEEKDEKQREADRVRRALEQMEVVRGALARHLALCCCLE